MRKSGCKRLKGRASPPPPKTRSGPQRVRMSGGERPIGAAKGKQSDTEALCQPPPPESNTYFINVSRWNKHQSDPQS